MDRFFQGIGLLYEKYGNELIYVLLFFVVGIGFVVYARVQTVKREKKAKEQKERSTPVRCIYCDSDVYWDESENGLFKCRHCRRHFVHGRKRTPEDQKIIDEESADVIQLKNYLEDTVTSYRMVVEHLEYPGWFAAYIEFSSDRKTIEISELVRDTEAPLFDERQNKEIQLPPLPAERLNIRTQAGEACFLHLLKDYIDEKHGSSLEAVYWADTLRLVVNKRA